MPDLTLDKERLENVQRTITKAAHKTKRERLLAWWPKDLCLAAVHLCKNGVCIKCGVTP